MRQAVVYARYSPGSTQTYQSIEGQLTECHKFAAANDLQIVRTYEDEHLTGRNDQRPAFQQLLKDSATAKWDIVLVYAIDRFGRNSIEIAINKYHLQKNGKTVISATQRTARNVDGSKNLDGILLENFYIGMAEYYSEELSQKVTRGLRESYAKGNFTGGRPILGYKAVDDPRSAGDRKPRKIVVIDEDTAPLVRYVFEAYAKGTSKKEIMDELTRRGYKNTKNKPLTLNSFQNNLTSRKYIGEVEHDGVVYTNIYPPLIDKATFETVQKRLARRKLAPAALKAKEDYILQGKLFCGHCGSSMVGESGTGKSGKKFYYYTCAKRKRERGCMKKPVKKDWIEEQIVRLLQGRILNDDVIRVIVDAALDLQEREKDDSVLRGFEAELSDVKRAIANIITAIEQGIITPSTKARLDELEGRRVDLENAIEDEKCQQPQLTREQLTFWLERFRDGDPADPKFRETFIDVFVSAVYLYDDHFRAVCNFTEDGAAITYDFVNDSASWADAGEVFDFDAPKSTICVKV